MRNTSFDPDRIKTIRFHLGMTQTEFAEYLGAGLSSVSDWEKGRHVPKRASVIRRLLDAEIDAERREREAVGV